MKWYIQNEFLFSIVPKWSCIIIVKKTIFMLKEFSKAITNPYVIVKYMNNPSMTLSIVVSTSIKTA